MADRLLSVPPGILAHGWGRLGPLLDARPLGEGHIHDTLLVTVGDSAQYVVQRINQHVFAEPDLVMGNLARVLGHLGQVAPGLVPELIVTDGGAGAWVDETQGWWRLWRYIHPSRSFNRTRDGALARRAGACFGQFQRLMSAFPGPDLAPVVPGFLELRGYLEQFDSIADQSAATATATATATAAERAFVEAHREGVDRFGPARDYIHGDCKLNNLLIAADRPEVIAMLDLDTVMIGHWAWDFGDLARSLLADFADDEMVAASRLFAEIVRGFVSQCAVEADPEALVQAPVHVGFMLGLRFLTDHLEGDPYFRTSRRGDNLERARVQFELVRRLQANRELLLAAAAGIVDHLHG